MVNKKLLLGLGSVLVLGSTIPFVLSCSLTKPNTKPNKPSDEGDKEPIDPSKPGGSGTTDSGGSLKPEDDNVVLTELPRENINDNTKLLPYTKLLKYALQIPQIKINNQSLTLQEQKERYKEILTYVLGESNNYYLINRPINKYKYSYLYHARYLWLKEGDIFKEAIPKYMEYSSRYFWNENNEWRKEFLEQLPKEDALVASTIAIPYYVHCQNMDQIATFISYYSWYKIKLIEATNQRGSAKEYFVKKGRETALDAAKNALAIAGKYFNPQSSQLMGNKNKLLFNSYDKRTDSPAIKDNHIAYKYMVDVVNREIAPFVFALDSDADDMVAPFHKRDSENVFAKVAGQKVKYKKDYTEETLKKSWTKWFNFYRTKLNWQFDEE